MPSGVYQRTPEFREKMRAVMGSPEMRRKASERMRGKTGDNAPAWKGGKTIDALGYVRVTVPGEYRTVFEHRLVMEQYLGRPLTKDEVVHHIDGDKQNNAVENLQVMSRSDHMSHHRTEGR